MIDFQDRKTIVAVAVVTALLIVILLLVTGGPSCAPQEYRPNGIVVDWKPTMSRDEVILASFSGYLDFGSKGFTVLGLYAVSYSETSSAKRQLVLASNCSTLTLDLTLRDNGDTIIEGMDLQLSQFEDHKTCKVQGFGKVHWQAHWHYKCELQLPYKCIDDDTSTTITTLYIEALEIEIGDVEGKHRRGEYATNGYCIGTRK